MNETMSLPTLTRSRPSLLRLLAAALAGSLGAFTLPAATAQAAPAAPASAQASTPAADSSHQ
jgi:hypothetical protein